MSRLGRPVLAAGRAIPCVSSLKAAELQAPEILGAQQVSDSLHHAAGVNLERVTCALSSPPGWPATDSMEPLEGPGRPKAYYPRVLEQSGALFLFSYGEAVPPWLPGLSIGDQVTISSELDAF